MSSNAGVIAFIAGNEALKAEIKRLRQLIEHMHLHYNPGMPGFDIEAALETLPNEYSGNEK